MGTTTDDLLLWNALGLFNDWWNYDWGNRVALTVDQKQSANSFTDFPLLVSLDGDKLDYRGISPDGGDIRFVDAAGNVLEFETETLNHNGNSVFWLKIPQLAPGENKFWIYYNNANAVKSTTPAQIWTDDYVAVYHLSETGGNGTTRNDSSRNALAGTYVDVNGNSVPGASGKIGRSSALSGDADAVTSGPDTKFTLATFTISGWFNCLDAIQFRTILARNVSITHRNFYLGLWENGEGFHNDGALAFRTGMGFVDIDLATTANYCDSAWHFFTAYVDQANGKAGLIVNNEPAITTNSFGVPWSGTAPFVIGHDGFTGGSRYFNGSLDEIRVQKIARSEEWIRAQYLSQNNSYISYGPLEFRP